MAQVSLVSRVSEGVLAELMEGSRVAKRYHELWRALSEEMKWLATLPAHVWAAVAGVAGTSAADLRSFCLRGGHVSYHFFWRQVLVPAGDLPWRLCRGDVASNLEELCNGEMFDEVVSQQMWRLMQVGFPRQQLIATVRLMAEIGWTTLPAEQQHGSLAAFRKAHPQYGMETLVSRTFMLLISRLMPSRSIEDKQLEKLSRDIHRLSAKNPDKAHGRHAYVSALFDHVKSRQWAGRRAAPKNAAKQIFTRHAAFWLQMSLARKRQYELLARRKANHKREAILQELEELRTQRELLIGRMATQARDVAPILMSGSALDDKHWGEFLQLMESEDFRAETRIAALRSAALETPLPMSAAVLQALRTHEVWEVAKPRMPQWANRLAMGRYYADDVAIMIRADDDTDSYYKVLYAYKNHPPYLALGHLELRNVPLVAQEVRGDNWARVDTTRFRFHSNYAACTSAAETPDVPETNIFVIPNLVHRGGMEVTSSWPPIPFVEFMAQLPEPERALGSEGGERIQRGRSHDDLVLEFPWLAALDEKEGFSGTTKGVASDHEAADDEEAINEDDAFVAGMRALDIARAALAEGAPHSAEDFKTRVLGGPWLIRTRGEGRYAVAGEAVGAFAIDFCRRRKVNRGFRCNYSVYGARVCGILCRLWCHKMQYFLDVETAATEGTELVFTPEHHAGYEEPTEVARLLAEPVVIPETRVRVEQVRALFRAA